MRSYLAALILLGMLLGGMPFSLWAITSPAEMLNVAEQQRTSNPDAARQLLIQLEPEFDSLPTQQQSQFLFLKAYLLAIKGELNSAIEIAISLKDTPHLDSKIKAHLLLANIYEAIKNYQQAYASLYLALAEVAKISEPELVSSVYTVAAQLHISAGAYEKAISYAQMIRRASEQPRALCISLSQELHANIRLTNAYNAEQATQALSHCVKADELLMAHSLEQFKAEVDINTDPGAVKNTMQTILPDLERIGFPYAILRSRYFFGYAQLKLGELPEALVELEQVRLLAAKLRDSRTENETLLLLAQLYEQQGNTLAANNAYKQHISALNTYINEYKQRSVAYHLAQADFMESENKLALLKSQNNLLQLESQLQKDQKFKALLITIAVTLLLLFVIYVLNNKRALLSRLATTDFLTKLYNRRYFSEAVSRQLNNRRQQEEYSLIVFDIDLFKQINDQYGHSTGDIVLTEIAERCSVHIRKQDILARIGGEEFAMFLPGCRLADAIKLAEQCRQSIADSPIVVNEQNISVTASFGIASGDSANFDTLLQQADAALYQAKAAGRNCSHSATANA